MLAGVVIVYGQQEVMLEQSGIEWTDRELRVLGEMGNKQETNDSKISDNC